MSGKFEMCPICKRYGFMDVHKCGSFFLCRTDDQDREEEKTVYADCPKYAAEKFLEERFSSFDYPRYMTILVVDEVAEKEYQFEVTVESVPEFHAEQISCKGIEEE